MYDAHHMDQPNPKPASTHPKGEGIEMRGEGEGEGAAQLMRDRSPWWVVALAAVRGSVGESVA